MTVDNSVCIESIDNANKAYRIDSRVRAYSYWQGVYSVMFTLAILLMTLMATVTGWAVLLVIITCLTTLLILYTQPKLLIHLTSPPMYHLDKQGLTASHGNWQLLWQTATAQELWEAKLIHCRRYGRCVQLSFLVSHPMPKNITHVIWQDQVSTEAWRRLSAQARW